MQAFPEFRHMPTPFWAMVKYVSETLGVVQSPQVSDRGQGIDLIEMVKAAVVFAVAHLRHQQTLGIIMAQQLDIHVEYVGKLPDRQEFFHKTSHFPAM